MVSSSASDSQNASIRLRLVTLACFVVELYFRLIISLQDTQSTTYWERTVVVPEALCLYLLLRQSRRTVFLCFRNGR